MNGKGRNMHLNSDSDLMCLIEVATKEMGLIGIKCHDMRWKIRGQLKGLAAPRAGESGTHEIEPHALLLSDETLRKTVEQIGNVIRLVECRLQELDAIEQGPPDCAA